MQLHGLHEGTGTDGEITAKKIAKNLAKKVHKNVGLSYHGLGEWKIKVSKEKFKVPTLGDEGFIFNSIGGMSRYSSS